MKHLSVQEFRAEGYLQEVNRLFLHPVGLALEVVVHADGTESLGGIWDCRDDPEGVIFGDGMIDEAKVAAVEAQREQHRQARVELLGAEVQQP